MTSLSNVTATDVAEQLVEVVVLAVVVVVLAVVVVVEPDPPPTSFRRSIFLMHLARNHHRKAE